MDNIELDKRLAFISDLDLSSLVAPQGEHLLGDHGGVRASAGRPSAYIDYGSLISFGADVDDGLQSDILSSMLFAQLWAQKKFDRQSRPQEWYNTYYDSLAALGWLVPSEPFNRYNASSSSYFVNRAVLELLQDPPNVEESIKSLSILSASDARLHLWDSSTCDATNGSFQVGNASMSDGNAVLRQGAFYFSTTRSAARFLWVSYPADAMQLYSCVKSMAFNRQAYDRVKNQVDGQLGDHVKRFVASLDI